MRDPNILTGTTWRGGEAVKVKRPSSTKSNKKENARGKKQKERTSPAPAFP